MKKKLTTAVIATIKDDPDGLRELLADLFRQTLKPTEVILVFAGMDAQSEHVLEIYSGKLPIMYAVLSAQATRSEARNAGVHTSTSDVILFTDAGCHPDEHWIEELVRPIWHDGAQLVSGYTGTWFHSDWELAQSSFVLVPRMKVESHPLPATRNMAIVRTLFVENGGFKADLNFAEDYEFSRRLRSRGIQAQYAPKAVVSWEPRKSYVQFFSMISQLTAGDMQSGMLRPGHWSMSLRYFALLAFFSLMWSVSGLQNAVFLSACIYLIYIVMKAMNARHLSYAQRFWYATFVPWCDFAVLTGIAAGLAVRMKARENRAA